MIKFLGKAKGDRQVYGFCFSHLNLERLEAGDEIVFSFDYAGHPDLSCVIGYLPKHSQAIQKTDTEAFKAVQEMGIEKLRVFVLSMDVMEAFRKTDYWSFNTHIPIASHDDIQMFMAGPTEEKMKQHLRECGLVF